MTPTVEAIAAGTSTSGTGREEPKIGAHRLLPARALRVAIFSDAIPGRNGVGTYYDDLVDHLTDLLGGVLLVSPNRNREGRRFPRCLPLPGDSTQRICLPRVRAVWRDIRALSPHVIVSATPGPFGTLGMTLAARTGAGFCVGVHTEFERLVGLYWRPSVGAILRVALGRWDRLMFRRARAVVVHNEALFDAVLKRGPHPARVVGTPIPKTFLSTPLSPISDPILSVSFVGRLAPEKRLEQVLESARALSAIHFHIAGDGPLSGEVGSWAREEPNVEALGWLDRSEVLRVLDTTDLLVLPSRYETFGSVALEAMARKRLALVSPHCGISRWPELAKGLIVMKKDERLVETLRRVCAMTSGERAARAETARGAAEELTRRAVSDWLNVIQDLARTCNLP